MNKNKLKTYAPQARLDFIEAVKARAALLGISASGGSPATRRGDVVIVEGREWPAKVGAQRDRLAAKIAKEGFEAVIDRVAYTWFNRFAALRYMELHDYLGHGHRVLSNTEGAIPEILAHAYEVDLPGLDREKVVELRLAGNRDGDLYRMVLVAQCNALSSAMPFLFERIDDDESELLLPDNLLRTDSVIAKMVSSIDEEDWREVEIIGWLYQFYISERKEQVMGKTVRSEDIPAATQLFTPNWIVKYLVHNSVGQMWLAANPTSSLGNQLPYRMEPCLQTPETELALASMVERRQQEDGGRINPESITILDPACGSGHILVEAYEVLKSIYLERGYSPRSIPRLILEKNLYGLDIDERAAQLASFTLLMKGRRDDRNLFSAIPRVNIVPLRKSTPGDAAEWASHLTRHGVKEAHLDAIVSLFVHANTFGSLIKVPRRIAESLASIERSLDSARERGDIYSKQASEDCLVLLQQAKMLAAHYDVVVANPPYMGYKGMNPLLKGFLEKEYPEGKADLFAAFILRAMDATKSGGHTSMITMHSWMFLPSYKDLRPLLKRTAMLRVMAHLGPRAFDSISGEIVQTTAFTYLKATFRDAAAKFRRLVEGRSEEEKRKAFLNGSDEFVRHLSDFDSIPDSPLAFWMSEAMSRVFNDCTFIENYCKPRQGMATADNERFLRGWYEVSRKRLMLGAKGAIEAEKSGCRWFPYNKGGRFRKWYGNNELVVNWEADGRDIKGFCDDKGKQRSAVRNSDFYFKPGITWTTTTSNSLAIRFSPPGSLFDVKGSSLFPKPQDIHLVMGFLGSPIADAIMGMLNPTMEFQVGNMSALPLKLTSLVQYRNEITEAVAECVQVAKSDWDEFEYSWDFDKPSFLSKTKSQDSLSLSWDGWEREARNRIQNLSRLESRNNSLFISAYGLDGELSADVGEGDITLATPDRETDCKRLISYAVGCMMGRYSLDEPGLIYADAGNAGFDSTRYKTFLADSDGIVPVTDELWFEDDAALRVSEFVKVVWGAESHEENLAWLAESLGAKNGETPEETVRRYLATSFYKDHLQTYKKRPIYWLFTSGKQGAFGALVYLHRYHDGTLSRMRSEYVVPLLSKYLDRIEMLQHDAEAATSAAARTKIQKRIDGLRKQHHELVGFEEKLRHLADSRIALDLDDGVKANYGKFGDLLAETKAITGGSEE